MGTWLKGKYYLGLLLAGVVAAVLVSAEQRQDWRTAQTSLLTILLLLALMVWDWWKANHKAQPLTGEPDVYFRATNKVLVWVAVGFAALVLNANRGEHWRYGTVAKAMGYGLMVAGAFFIVGVLLGFLFGLRPTGASTNKTLNSPAPPHTNLEEIADWLTKLILGAGLVELTHMGPPIRHFVDFMARGVSPVYLLPAGRNSPSEQYVDPGGPSIALAIMSFFSASGLLYGYLWTRYHQALKDAEPSGAPRSAEEVIRDRAA